METKNSFEFDEPRSKKEILETNRAFADFNKATHEHNQRETAKENKKERLLQLDAARNGKKLLEMEAHAMDDCRSKAIEDLKHSQENNKRVAKDKEMRETADDAIVETGRKYNERMRSETRKSMENLQISKDKTADDSYRKNYAIVKNLQDEEKKQYDDFVGKPANIMNDMFTNEDQHELNTKIMAREIMKDNIIESERKKLQKLTDKQEEDDYEYLQKTKLFG